MSHDWDDWGDDGEQSDGVKSEGWDWPVEEEEKLAATKAAPCRRVVQVGRTSCTNSSSRAPPRKSFDDKRRAPRDEKAEEIFSRELEELTEKFFSELRGFLEDVVDPSVRESTNKELEQRDYCSVAGYYEGRDELATYTIGTELQRMHYTIIAEDGNDVAMTNMALARDFLTDRTGHPIVRMANQSIFADMLQAVQGCLLRPELEISVINRESDFSLDFSRGVLDAKSLFAVSTVGRGGPSREETLEIAHIKGTACIDIRNQTCRQELLSPELRMVFDDDMRASARVLARHALIGGGVNGGIGDGDNGGGGGSAWGMKGVSGAIRESLARASSGGMERAAAAGTGLLANVMAGVGSAIGASRTPMDEDENDPFGLRSLTMNINNRRNTGEDPSDSGALPSRSYGEGQQDSYNRPLSRPPPSQSQAVGARPGIANPDGQDDRLTGDLGPVTKSGRSSSPSSAATSGLLLYSSGVRQGTPTSANRRPLPGSGRGDVDPGERPGKLVERRGSCTRGTGDATRELDARVTASSAHGSANGTSVLFAKSDGASAGTSREETGASKRPLGGTLGLATATGEAVWRGLWGGLQGAASAGGNTDRQANRLYRRDGEDDSER